MEQGLTHIYCGDGKGKTTAAIGLAVRAAGSGKKVLIARFLKNEVSGELNALECVSGVEIIHLERSFGFYKNLSEENKRECRKMYRELWDTATKRAVSEQFDMLVIDEFMAAYRYGIIEKEAALRFLREKPSKLELVLTGREPSEELLELADYVSEIKKVKHPFDRGVKARKGIEF